MKSLSPEAVGSDPRSSDGPCSFGDSGFAVVMAGGEGEGALSTLVEVMIY